MGAICNGFTIIFLGLIGTGSDATGRLDVSKSQGGMMRRNKVLSGNLHPKLLVVSALCPAGSVAQQQRDRSARDHVPRPEVCMLQVADVETAGDTTPPMVTMPPTHTAHTGAAGTAPMHNVDVLKTSLP